MNFIKKFNAEELKKLLQRKNLLEFNRVISKSHTKKMQKSILECGLLRLPVIGDISSFDKRKYIIVDGQHLCSALMNLPRNLQPQKVDCLVKKYENKRDLIEDISRLNNTQKTWNDENYLNAWYKYGRDNENFSNYAYMYNQYNEVFKGLPCGFLVDVYSLNKNDFKQGKLKFRNREFSDKLANISYTLKTTYNKSSFTLQGFRIWAFDRLKNNKDVDWQKLESRLVNAVRKREDKNCQKREDFRDFVEEIYTKL